MCLSWCCDALYQGRCFFFRLSSILMILDLGLTLYIIVQLTQIDTFACCTDNLTLNDQCSYMTIGGTNNIGIDSEGYCIQKSSDTYCKGDLATCAEENSVDMSKLCSTEVLNEVADLSWEWLMIILVIKTVGLIFLIALEIRSLINTRKKATDQANPQRNREPGEEDVEATVGCCDKCKRCSWECCKSCLTNTTIFILKIFFMIFGTAATALAIWILIYTDRVSLSNCRVLSGALQADCYTVQNKCTFEGGQNYYIVIFGDLNLTGPYIVDLITSASTTVLWVVRFAILRYYLNQSKLASV